MTTPATPLATSESTDEQKPLYKYYQKLQKQREESAASGGGSSKISLILRLLKLATISLPPVGKSVLVHLYYFIPGTSGVTREWGLKYRMAVGVLKAWMAGLGKNARKVAVHPQDQDDPSKSDQDLANTSQIVIKPKILQLQKTTSHPAAIPKEKSLITLDSFKNNQKVIDFLKVTAKGEWPDHAEDTCSIDAEWVEYLPAGTPDRKTIIVMFHGGAHILGSKEMYRFMSYRYAQASGASLYVVNYRLAPVNPYPCAVIDAVSSIIHIQSLYPESRVFVAGDSAGGNLAMATMLVMRDMKLKQVDGAWLISPWLDLTHSSPSISKNATSDYLPAPNPTTDIHTNASPTRRHFYTSDAYLTVPYVSPLFADVSGLPRTLIQCGGAEILRDECYIVAKRMHCVFEEYVSHVHVFQVFGFDKGARRAVERGGVFVKGDGGGSGEFLFSFKGELVKSCGWYGMGSANAGLDAKL